MDASATTIQTIYETIFATETGKWMYYPMFAIEE